MIPRSLLILWHAVIVLVAISPAVVHFSGAFAIAAPATAALAQGAQRPKQSAAAQPASRHGEKLFAASCAGCHGLDGRGGERAPSIAAGHVQRLSDVQIFGIVQHGITGTGMPSFHSLADSEINSVVAYLRTLQGTKGTFKLPGDPVRGKAIFFGKAECAGCHMAAGQGGFIASDLSGYARTHSADETRGAITSPNPNGDRPAKTATVTTRDGGKYVGRVRNEDNSSLQLQTLDGAFLSLDKATIRGVEYSAQSMMPSNYGSTLSSDELNDLFSYLMSVANSSESGTPKKSPEEE